MNADVQRLKELHAPVRHLAGVNALLGWDQETYMPSAGIEARAEQIALIEGMAHARMTDPEVESRLAALGCGPSQPMGDPSLAQEDRLYLRAFYRSWSRAARLPEAFVMEKARAVSRAQAAWASAKNANDFPAFRPHLSSMVDIARREAAYLGGADKPYDALLDQYEPGSTAEGIEPVFSELQAGLVALLSKIRSRPQVDDSCHRLHCPAASQARFARRLMDALGLEGERSRLDESAHPFTTTIGWKDVRITTHYHEDHLASSISSTIHEAGHALYELGLPERWQGTALCDPASTAIHESQSRFWENVLGRSISFWKAMYPRAREDLAPVLDGVPLENFWRAFNKVEPSLIRIEADEVTYSLHVILRFRLERALMDGRLEAAGVPEAWNAGMEELLGIRPPDDRRGCLQDIHWSMGAIGYFPGYALGNLYAAQFTRSMEASIGKLEGHCERGDFRPILGWLREHVHAEGAALLPSELVQKATASPLSPRPFLDYLEGKYAEVYGF